MIIKNIILDLGGVLIDVDYHKTNEAFKALGLSRIDELYSKKKQQTLFDDMDKGLITDEEFRLGLKMHLPSAVTGRQVDEAWNAMLGRIPVHRMRTLDSVKTGYRLFLLSNTNRIHVKRFGEIIEEDHGPRALDSRFEKIYLSCEMGMRKPDREIFEKVIAASRIEKSETVFIDDSIQHVHGAEAAGIRAHYLDLENDTLEKLLGRVLQTI